MKNLYIKKVYIKNFRGYEGEKQFDFTSNNKPNNLILLSGANGYGKTSLLEAIEWCLTGTVKRVYNDYIKRCPTSKEQQIQDSDKGLIKNTNSIDNEIYVKLNILYKEKEMNLKREYIVVDSEVEGLKLNFMPDIESEDGDIREELRSYLIDTIENFYDNFICSYDKNVELYSKGRKEIYEIFSCLYTEFKEANIIKDRLVTIKENLLEEKLNSEKEMEKIISERNKYENLSKEMEGINSDLREEYPKNRVFNEEVVTPYEFIENTNIDSQKNLNNQIAILQSIYYLKIKDNTEKLNSKLKYEYNLILLEQLENEYNSKLHIIEKMKGINIREIKEEKDKSEILYNKVKNSLSLDNIEIILDEIIQEDKIKEFIGKGNIKILLEYKNNIKSNLDKKSLYNERKSLYDTNSPVMLVMRYIIDNTDTLKEYRNANNKCPVCGSEEFKNSEIGTIAKTFLGEKDIERQEIIKKIKTIEMENNNILKKVSGLLTSKFQELIKYYDDILELNKELDNIYSICMLLNMSDINKEKILIQKLFYEQEIKGLKIDSSCEEQTINSLEMLDLPSIEKFKERLKGYATLNIDEQVKLLTKIIKEFENQNIKLENISEVNIEEEDLKNIETKLNICKFINCLINKNNVYQQIIEFQKIEKEKQKEIGDIEKQVTKLKSIIKEVNKTIKDNEKKEIERIAEPLDKIYRKITRNTNIKEIRLKRGNGQKLSELEIIDSNDKPLPFGNILSAGQLSTLSISIFLSKALLNDGNLKCYLMDEPIQTMDDLNIISFIDLIRFELENDEDERFIDQLIISTCDNDLEKLIMHKIKSFNIPICNYNFQGQGRYERVL
ncbi:RecF/RecN/SMC domain protein [Clostridium bornimense]|uniref:Nuclease SbcCD subunit C n=1 Tax=Clostridium bornimense TaxID=1216932 RepID=W6SFF8_9CLOT|nr:AAA family ATPase [Clostridium bornimense]CDM68415.1 RecF/RecN/SMC domain protein [Clostridium bornimense]